MPHVKEHNWLPIKLTELEANFHDNLITVNEFLSDAIFQREHFVQPREFQKQSNAISWRCQDGVVAMLVLARLSLPKHK